MAIIINSTQYPDFVKSNPDFIRHEVPSTKPSKTVPGQVEDMKTLVARFIRGDNMEVFPASFDPDETVPPGIEMLDKIERAEMAMATRDLVHDIREKQYRRQQQKAATPSPTPSPVAATDAAPPAQPTP